VTVVDDIEGALVAQWSHFGRWPRGELHDSDGFLWFETPIRQLPYNGVLRTRLDAGPATDAAIARLVERLRGRDADFFWVVHPTATPGDLADRLATYGLRPVERMNCMSLELADWRPGAPPEGVAFEEVVDEAGLDAYTELTMRYWEIADEARDLVAEVHRYWGPGRSHGHRYLALADGRAVGKGYISLAGPPGVGSIYGMSVVPEARGRGIAGGLTTALLERAREAGCHRVVLHATDMAVSIYRRAGFADVCPIEVFATAALWSEEH
jgi:GNAT superfamily N-acetyltransferase